MDDAEQWEYCCVDATCGMYWDALIRLHLKQLGEEGWEVFHVTERRNEYASTGIDDVHLKAYLKRIKQVRKDS